MGLVRASAKPVALAAIPVQKESSGPLGMCSSRWRKSGRKGKGKEKPRMAVKAANHEAARFLAQPTGPYEGLRNRTGPANGFGLLAHQLPTVPTQRLHGAP